MDTKQIGCFLAELRRERQLTQEQLGEEIGVTNKTVSRWENGNYLPPVEALQALSAFYGITINEILSGRRLKEDDYKKEAESNLKVALASGSFAWKERLEFFKNKWKKEHLVSLILSAVIAAVLFAVGCIYDNSLQIIALLFLFAVIIIRHNQMMAYAEQHTFDKELQE